MDHGCYTVFVPYYPMLTTDFYAGYKLSTLPATFTQEEPTDADVYYATTGRVYVDGKRTSVEGFKALPENWADSMYWTVDALSNLCESGNVTDEQKETVNKVVEQLQNACYTYFADMKASVAAATSDEAAAVAATETSAKIAAEIHENLVKLVNSIK